MKKTMEQRFWSKVDTTKNCWEWTACRNRGGYGVFPITTPKEHSAHRISWIFHNGPIPNGLNVLHHCDNPCCVKPDHLFLGTQRDNNRDSANKGRSHAKRPNRKCKGESNPCSKLTDNDVRFIKSFPTYRGSGVELAKKFGVTRTLISYICKNKIWNHIVG